MLLAVGAAAIVVITVVAAVLWFTVLNDNQSAGEAAVERYELIAEGRYGDAWETLHPSHQAVVSKDLFVRCGEESGSGPVDGIEVVRTEQHNDEEMYGIGPVDYTLVEVRWLSGSEFVNVQDRMIDVNGDWRWTMQQGPLDAFLSGCP